MNAPETFEQMIEDSNIIFTVISTSDFDNFEMAERAVVVFYAMDKSISRAGISHALELLRQYYER